MLDVSISATPHPQIEHARPETNLLSHRKLHPELKCVDLRLQQWGLLAKPRYTELGYPTRSATELANEGGLLAKTMSPVHPPEWPEEIAVADSHVAKLPTRHLAAVMATYFYLALPLEQRCAIYCRMARYLARTRPPPAHCNRSTREGASVGSGAFWRDLDRARWTLRYALDL
jgi:hypothetical protein